MIDRTVETKTRIAAPPEVLFAYFVDPELYRRLTGTSAELDPRPGGLYRVVMPSGDLVRGEYQSPTRIVFTCCFEGHAELPPGSSTVEVTLQADGDGTLFRLHHDRLPTDVCREQQAMGWQLYVDRLAIAAVGGDPGPDWLNRATYTFGSGSALPAAGGSAQVRTYGSSSPSSARSAAAMYAMADL